MYVTEPVGPSRVSETKYTWVVVRSGGNPKARIQRGVRESIGSPTTCRHPSKYEVIVENRTKDAVVVYVSGRRLGSKDEDEIIEGCSTKRFGPKSWFAPKPTRDLRVSVYDSHGVDRRHILETKASPQFPQESSDDWYVEVVVPGATDDECQ